MKEILICWIGFADLKASAGKEDVGLGPIAQAVTSLSFDEIHLISDRPESEDAAYIKWLNSKCVSKIILHKTELSSPVPRRFDRVMLQKEQRVGVDRSSRNSDCAAVR